MLQFRAIALAVAGSLALAAPAFAGKLSIVIDDFGYRPQTENQVLALPSTISVAVLPKRPLEPVNASRFFTILSDSISQSALVQYYRLKWQGWDNPGS